MFLSNYEYTVFFSFFLFLNWCSSSFLSISLNVTAGKSIFANEFSIAVYFSLWEHLATKLNLESSFLNFFLFLLRNYIGTSSISYRCGLLDLKINMKIEKTACNRIFNEKTSKFSITIQNLNWKVNFCHIWILKTDDKSKLITFNDTWNSSAKIFPQSSTLKLL